MGHPVVIFEKVVTIRAKMGLLELVTYSYGGCKIKLRSLRLVKMPNLNKISICFNALVARTLPQYGKSPN